jgi:Na+/melibiose symporter-like transporter
MPAGTDHTTTHAPPNRLPPLRKLGYGVGCVGYSLPHQIIAAAFLLYATAILKIPSLWAGAIIAVSAVWDAVSDPLMGLISDNTRSRRFGRRHLYILVGGVAVSVLTYFFWSVDPADSTRTKLVLLFGLVILIKTALTVFVAPYNALGGELSTDYDERSSIQSYRAMFYLVGMILALVGSNVVFFRSTPEFERGQLNPAAYPDMGTTFAVFALVAVLLCFFATRVYIPQLPQPARDRAGGATLGSVMHDLAGALTNRDFRAVALMIFIVEVGFQIGIAIGFHINTYTYKLPGPIIGIHGLVILGCSIASQPLWLRITRRRDKRTALIIGMVSGFFGFFGAPVAHVALGLFPIDAPSLPYTLGFFFVFAGLGNGAFMSIPYSMVADAVDADQVRTGKRHEGLYFGFYTFAYKLGTSLSLVASGLVLHVVAFDPNLETQTAATQYNLAMVPAYLLLLFGPLALLCVSRYTIDRSRHAEIRALLDDRGSLGEN